MNTKLNTEMLAKTIQQLNTEFGVENLIKFSIGENGLAVCTLEFRDAVVCAYLYGGHVTSYQVAGHEVLWVSPDAIYQAGKAIRGGVPVCWPWFGPHGTDHSKPNHGFARNQLWSIKETLANDDAVGLVLCLEPNSQIKKIFDHEFELTLAITVADDLTLNLTATNRSDQSVEFGGALHSYFAIDEINDVRLSGLNGVNYIDQLQNHKTFTQKGNVHFDKELDSVYVETGHEVLIEQARPVRISKSGSMSTVVWNPWIEKSAKTGDLPDDAYKSFVCVETANAFDDVRQLAAGQSHSLIQTIQLVHP